MRSGFALVFYNEKKYQLTFTSRLLSNVAEPLTSAFSSLAPSAIPCFKVLCVQMVCTANSFLPAKKHFAVRSSFPHSHIHTLTAVAMELPCKVLIRHKNGPLVEAPGI